MDINFCTETANIWQLVGYVLLVFKIVIPILLIVFGMINLGQAVIGSKDDDLKKAISTLIRRVIAAVIIFFLPTIISWIFGVVAGWRNDEKVATQYNVCRKCITNPNGSLCRTNAENAWRADQ